MLLCALSSQQFICELLHLNRFNTGKTIDFRPKLKFKNSNCEIIWECSII